MKSKKFILLTLLFTLFLNSSILEAKERAGERSDRDSSLRYSNERREKLDYDGETSGVGKTIGGSIGSGIVGYVGSKFGGKTGSPIEKGLGGLAGAEIGGRIGGRLGDRWEKRMNQYSNDR